MNLASPYRRRDPHAASASAAHGADAKLAALLVTLANCEKARSASKIDVVVAGKSDDELMAVLVSAFQRHAAEVAVAQPSQPPPRGKPKLPEALTYPHVKVAA